MVEYANFQISVEKIFDNKHDLLAFIKQQFPNKTH